MTIYLDNVAVSERSTLSMAKANIGGRLFVGGRRQFRVTAELFTKLVTQYDGSPIALPPMRVKASAGSMLLIYGHGVHLPPGSAPDGRYSSDIYMRPVTGLQFIGATEVVNQTLISADTAQAQLDHVSWIFPCVCTADVDIEVSVWAHLGAASGDYRFLRDLSQMVIEL